MIRTVTRAALMACPLSAVLAFAAGAAFAATESAHRPQLPFSADTTHGSRPLPVYGRAAVIADACRGASPRGCANGSVVASRGHAEPRLCIGASPRGCLLRAADAA